MQPFFCHFYLVKESDLEPNLFERSDPDPQDPAPLLPLSDLPSWPVDCPPGILGEKSAYKTASQDIESSDVHNKEKR
jgi:hypothetical protein